MNRAVSCLPCGRGARVKPDALLLALVLLSACTKAAPAPAAQRTTFPSPDRSVASIVSPSWDSETTRDQNGEADRVLTRLRIGAEMRVADIGAGSGYYTVRLARVIGPWGRIYAEDVDSNYLRQLEARLAREGIRGVQLILGTQGDPSLPPASVDLAILSHMYHEIVNPFELMYNLHRSLAPDAKVAIVDVDRPTQRHGTPPGLLRCELAAVGYREIDFIDLDPAEGYLAVFAPPETLPAVEQIGSCKQRSK